MNTTNIAALLIDDCKTIGIKHANGDVIYVYKTVENFEVEDFAIVKSSGRIKVVQVVEVHDVPQISVSSEQSLEWIVQKLDTSAHDRLTKKEADFRDMLLQHEQENIRSQAIAALGSEMGISDESLKKSIEILNEA